MIWKLRRSARDAVDGSTARQAEPLLEPIQLFTLDGEVLGAIAAEGRRISDLMAAEPALRIQTEDGAWSSISLAEVLIVVPPRQISNRRIHRTKRRVAFDVPPYRVVGTAHLPPGTQLDPFVLRTGRSALAVTNAWIRDDAADQDHHAEVAIVTVRAITGARELLGPA